LPAVGFYQLSPFWWLCVFGESCLYQSRRQDYLESRISLISLVIGVRLKLSHSLCNKMVVVAGPPSCHNMGRSFMWRNFARVVSSRASRRFSGLQAGSVNICWLTKRALDAGESARFQAFSSPRPFLIGRRSAVGPSASNAHR
jgi:hypothetical protein